MEELDIFICLKKKKKKKNIKKRYWEAIKSR